MGRLHRTPFYPARPSPFSEVGVQTMPLAIVLINAEVGSEDELLGELRKLNNVSEAHAVYGVFDIVAKVEAKTMKELKEVITSKVRKLKNLRSSLTMMVTEGT
jgi:DNA-binding Lrp family transcriptional regulator